MRGALRPQLDDRHQQRRFAIFHEYIDGKHYHVEGLIAQFLVFMQFWHFSSLRSRMGPIHK